MSTMERQKSALQNLLGMEGLPSSVEELPSRITLPDSMITRAVGLAGRTANDLRIRAARLRYTGTEWVSKAERRGPPFRQDFKRGLSMARPHNLSELSKIIFRPMIYLCTNLPEGWPETQEQIANTEDRPLRLLLSKTSRDPVRYPAAFSSLPSSGDITYSLGGLGGTLGVLYSSTEGLSMFVRNEPDEYGVFSSARYDDREQQREGAVVELRRAAEQAADLDEAAARDIMLSGIARAVQGTFGFYVTDNPLGGVLDRVQPVAA